MESRHKTPTPQFFYGVFVCAFPCFLLLFSLDGDGGERLTTKTGTITPGGIGNPVVCRESLVDECLALAGWCFWMGATGPAVWLQLAMAGRFLPKTPFFKKWVQHVSTMRPPMPGSLWVEES